MAEVAETTKRERGPRKAPANNDKRTPFPDSLVGKSTGGIIHEVFKTKFGTGKFGFILVGEGDFDRDTVPRIYFNFSEFSDSDYSAPRKGYSVNFIVTKDEESRLAATSVTLTEEGKVTAEAREKVIAQNPTPESSAKSKPRRARVMDPREVTLTLNYNGVDQQIVAKLGETLGKLKHNCITAMETENIALQVFTGDGRLLSKEILGAMVEGDSIMLKEKDQE